MRWYTCTPVAFGGGPDFFARDSGLLSRGFQALGVESRAVMSGERMPEDLDELVRTRYENLESAVWWKSQNLDGVVLYAWGLPRFLGVAKAIRKAGIMLVLNQDSGGLASPRCGFGAWLREQWMLAGRRGWLRVPWFLIRCAHALTLAQWTTERGRAKHFEQGDWIGMVTPGALARYRRLCRSYGKPELAGKLALIPHPVTTDCRFRPEDVKLDAVVAVGRWVDEAQKRPKLLVAALERMLGEREQTVATLVGEVPSWMEAWHRSLAPEKARRVRMIGNRPHAEVVDRLREARVLVCSSAFESSPIVAAEAVCCGATVVSFRSPSLPGPRWFSRGDGGRLARREDAESLGAALVDELNDWDRGARDPSRLSDRWVDRLHASRVAEHVLRLCEHEVSGVHQNVNR